MVPASQLIPHKRSILAKTIHSQLKQSLKAECASNQTVSTFIDAEGLPLKILEGFGYKWCTPIRREDLFSKKSFSVKCPHTDPKEASFRFQAYVQLDENGDK